MNDGQADTGRGDAPGPAPGDDPTGDAGPMVAGGAGELHRLHPHVRLIWVGRVAVVAFLVGAAVTVAERVLVGTLGWLGPAVFTLAFVVGAAHAIARQLVWRYRLREESVYLERGVLTRVETVVPYVRVQHVDVRRSLPERLLGLGTVVVYTAGTRGADVAIPGLQRDHAEALQTRLQRLAIAAEGADAV